MGPLLVLFAHPAYPRSRANRALREALTDLETVVVHDLYDSYPDFLIDVGVEQARVLDARGLVAQHPLYWYSMPALMKEWMDLVLTHGFAYGAGGQALAGKPWMTAVTTAGRIEAYGPEGRNRFPIEALLRPMEATAHLCGAQWQPPFVSFAADSASAADLDAEARRYRDRVARLAAAAHLRAV